MNFITSSSKLIGKFSHDVQSGNLIIPRRVNANGTHLTYNVTHFHDFNDDNGIDFDEQYNKLHYHIDLNDETIHVELR